MRGAAAREPSDCAGPPGSYPGPMSSRGRAKLAMSQGVSVWLLEAPEGFGDAGFHSHHAIQITVRFEGNLALTGDGQTLSADVIAVAPDFSHKLTADGLLGIVFVEPESRMGAILSSRLFSERGLVELECAEFRRLIEPLRNAFTAPLEREQMVELGSAAASALSGVQSEEPTERRILSIIDYAAAHLDKPVTLNGAAQAAGVYLSPSRLRHLFVEQTGLAFKTYMVWLRLVRAVQLYSEGQSLTEAAHSAGFADSAHLSRAFKRTFGSPATTLTRL